ncbi:MAG: hypothetical protein AAGK66_02770, partial [Pseudomonadota bacterium]
KRIVSWSPVGLIERAWTGVSGVVGRALGRAHGQARSWLTAVRGVMAWSPEGVLRQAWDKLPNTLRSIFARMRSVIGEGLRSLRTMMAKPFGTIKSVLGFEVAGDSPSDEDDAPKRPPVPPDAPPRPPAPADLPSFDYPTPAEIAASPRFEDFDMPDVPGGQTTTITYGDVLITVQGGSDPRATADEVMRRFEEQRSGALIDVD